MKKYLLEILDFFKYKLENDKCTSEDMAEAFNIISSGVVCEATVKDIADFYGQSESNVRNVVFRKSTPRSRRVTMYNFIHLSRFVPDRWRRRTKKKES